jgi:molybdopterin molybdotransferase
MSARPEGRPAGHRSSPFMGEEGSEPGRDLASIEDVRAEILSRIDRLPDEEIDLSAAWSRVLREDLEAGEPVPSFDASTMDGYAVRAADIAGASTGSPAVLPLAGVVPAGPGSGPLLPPGTAMRILTGAPLPAGADAVVPQELVAVADGRIAIEAAVARGANIRLAGSDLRPGDIPLRSGMRMTGPRMAIAAALGRVRLRVGRKPRIAVLSSGDELVEAASRPGPGQVRSANAFALIGLLENLGASVLDLPIVRDRIEDVRSAFRLARTAGAHAVVSTGGASVGDRDLIRALALADGDPGRFYQVAMRPGKPLVFARADGVPLFGLPGNPASAIVSFAVFVRPAIRRMLGEEPEVPERFPVVFGERFRYRSGRTFVLRALALPGPDGRLRVAEAGEQGSASLAPLARANVLVFLPGDREEVLPGEMAEAEWI